MVTPIDIRNKTYDIAGGKKLVVVAFSGELDETNIDEVAKEVYKIIDAAGEGNSMMFDFTGLNYMNSKSIGFLSDWHLKLDERSSKLIVAGAKDNILDILQTVGLDNFVEIMPSVDEAMKKLGAAAGKETTPPPAPKAAPAADKKKAA